jgi:hypothetical protein
MQLILRCMGSSNFSFFNHCGTASDAIGTKDPLLKKAFLEHNGIIARRLNHHFRHSDTSLNTQQGISPTGFVHFKVSHIVDRGGNRKELGFFERQVNSGSFVWIQRSTGVRYKRNSG